ncbi:MAG: amidohydrolase family protein [Candidatus Poribacteria bacterium]
MIVDFHVHAFPDKVASKAIETLEAIYGAKCFSDGKIDSLLENMIKTNVDVSVIQPVSTDPRQVMSINTWSAGISQIRTENSPNPIVGFGTIHPKFEDYHDEIQRMKELGIKGIKFQPSFQEFYPDDESMFPIYEDIVKAGMVLMFHAGDEIKPAKLVYSTPPRLAKVLDAMKSVFDDCDYYVMNGSKRSAKFVAAHLGGYQMWDQVEDYLLGRELYFDISYVFGHLDNQRILRMVRDHGIERILFGSDFPFSLPDKDMEYISQLTFRRATEEQMNLTNDEKEAILSKNALRLLE